MSAFSRRYGGGAASPRVRRLPRIALASVLGVAVAVGACALPSEYPVDLGQGVEIVLDAGRWDEVDVERLAEHLGQELMAERIEVQLSRSREEGVGPDGAPFVREQMRMQLFAFGGDPVTDDRWDDLVADFPALADARVSHVPLSGTVHGTVGGRLSERWLDLTLDRHGVEAAEQQILEQLRAEGIAPEDAIVDITTTEVDGHRRIEVRVEAEHDSEHDSEHDGQP